MFGRKEFWALSALAAGLLLTGVGVPARAAPPKPVITSVVPDHGPVSAGQTITVNGSGFVAGDTFVMLGDTVSVTADVSSSTSLTFVVPALEAGTVLIRVQVGDEESAASTYTVVAPPVVVPPVVVESPNPPVTSPGVVREDDPAPETTAAPRPDRPAVVHEVPRAQPPELAHTGARTASTAEYAVVMILGGIALVLLGRRRRTEA